MNLNKWTDEQKQLAINLSNGFNKLVEERKSYYNKLEQLWNSEEWAKRTPQAIKEKQELENWINKISTSISALSSTMPKMEIDFDKLPKNTTIYRNNINGTSEKMVFLKMKNTKRMYHPVFDYDNGKCEMRINNWENANFSTEPLFK